MRSCSGRIRPKRKESTWLDVGLWRPQPVGAFVVIYAISASRFYLCVIATRDALGRNQCERQQQLRVSRTLGRSVNFSESAVYEFEDREGAPSRSHSSSFDQRRRPDTLRTAIAMAFFWPTRTTSLLPRVTPV